MSRKETKFKQTEVGMIPEDWEVKNISKTCSIKARIGWQGLKSTEYLRSGNYILVTGTDFKNGFIDWSTCNYVSEWRFKQDKNIQIKKGDVLVTKDGTIGKVAFLNEIPMNGTLNSGVFVVRSKDNNAIDSVYLSLVFKSLWFDNFLDEITSGSTIVHLYQKDFVKFNFPVPSSIKEQTAIATALSDVDHLIESLGKLVVKKKRTKQGAMQQLLTGKKRLPGFGPKASPRSARNAKCSAAKPGFKQTELGTIPEDWEVESFGKLVSIFRGGSPRPIEAYITSNPLGINWIKIGDVKEGAKYITSTEERIIAEGKNRSREVHKGDFILSNSMSFGRPYILKVDGCIHDGWLTIQDYQKTFDTDFLYYMLSSEVVFSQYVSMAAGSSVQNLNKEKVAAVKLFYPSSKAEQTAIAQVLGDMDAEIGALEAKLAKYRKLKTGMMQQLLTGKIRLI